MTSPVILTVKSVTWIKWMRQLGNNRAELNRVDQLISKGKMLIDDINQEVQVYWKDLDWLGSITSGVLELEALMSNTDSSEYSCIIGDTDPGEPQHRMGTYNGPMHHA